MTYVSRKKNTGEPTTNGGEFGTQTRSEATVSLSDPTMSTLLMTDGSTRDVPTKLLEKFRGVTEYGFNIISQPDMRNADGSEFLSILTPCCNATDKGTEYGIVCRACYRELEPEEGSYFFPGTPMLKPAGSQNPETLTEIAEADCVKYHADNALLSLVTTQGTSIAEATLCVEHFTEENRATAWNATAQDSERTFSPVWASSSSNESVHCLICGLTTYNEETTD